MGKSLHECISADMRILQQRMLSKAQIINTGLHSADSIHISHHVQLLVQRGKTTPLPFNNNHKQNKNIASKTEACPPKYTLSPYLGANNNKVVYQNRDMSSNIYLPTYLCHPSIERSLRSRRQTTTLRRFTSNHYGNFDWPWRRRPISIGPSPRCWLVIHRS